MARITPSIKAWNTGSWTSGLCDISKQSFTSTGDNKWGILRWWEDNTSQESKAYVRVDILNSSGATIQSDLIGTEIINNRRFNRSISIGLLKDVATIDIKVRFKLFALTKQPQVNNIELGTFNSW